jgi:DNA-binding transcriptional LysR family regulator
VFLLPRKSALGNLRFEALTQESARLAVSPKHPFTRRDTVSLADAAREPFVVYNREEYPDYHRRLIAVFAKIKSKLRIVEEHDGFTSLIPAIEAGRGVALVSESFIYSAGKRVKLLRLTPEPKPEIFGRPHLSARSLLPQRSSGNAPNKRPWQYRDGWFVKRGAQRSCS